LRFAWPQERRHWGIRVTVVSYDSPGQAKKAVQEDHARVPGAELLIQKVLPMPSRMERLTARNARSLLKNMLPDFDVIQTHDAWSALSRGTMALAHKLKVPFVLLPNGMFDPWAVRHKGFKKRLMLAAGYRKLLNHALFYSHRKSG